MDMPYLSTVEDSRRRELLTAVARVLVEKQKQAGEMQEILEQTGMLFEDFAMTFEDLDDVLLSLARCVCEWIGDGLGSDADRPTSYDDMLEGLIEFGRRYTHANATILPGIFRVFLTESSRRSSLQQSFYASGPATISIRLTDFLQRAKSRHFAEFPDSDRVSEALMGMLREPLYYALALHTKKLSPALATVDRAPEVVRLFVQGCAGRHGR